MKNLATFFAFARARHEIYLKRAAGAPPPWTSDPILAKYKFTNVFRELDRTTVWFREHIREPLRGEPHVLFATVAFRWFNRIGTAELIEECLLTPEAWNAAVVEDILRAALPAGPWTNGAYIIKTPDGMDKLKGVLWCIENFRKEHLARAVAYCHTPDPTLKGCWEILRRAPCLGDFMSFEVVTDLRHTYLLDKAWDIDLWANPGPGACRGYGRVTGEGKDRYDRGNERDRATVITGMQSLLVASRGEKLWPAAWGRWEMREVEMWLCEHDKYQRVLLGEGRPKQLFKPKASLP